MGQQSLILHADKANILTITLAQRLPLKTPTQSSYPNVRAFFTFSNPLLCWNNFQNYKIPKAQMNINSGIIKNKKW